MGRKCSVYGCKTGYATLKANKKIAVHSFPKDRNDLEKWIKKLPNKLSPKQITRNIFFENTTKVPCRNGFITIFSDFPSFFHVNITVSTAALRRLFNILMERFASLSQDYHNTEQKRRKMTKLLSM